MDRKPHAVVVGAGPGGALAAIELAQQGFAVDVIEAREEPDPAAEEGYRSYAMVRHATCAFGVFSQPRLRLCRLSNESWRRNVCGTSDDG